MGTYLDLNVNLSEEQKVLREGVHKFAASVLRPASRALDRLADPAQVIASDSPLWDVLRRAYALGYHTLGIPQALGGLGLSGLDEHLVLEEMGWGSADFAIALAAGGFPYQMVAATGNQELIEEFVKPFVADRDARYIGCWAITEPDHGSDTLMPGTEFFHDPRISGQVVAALDGDHYVIRGQKSAWVSNGTIASHALTFLTIEPSKGMAGGGVAIVPLDLPGVSRGKPLDKLGQRALNQGELFFDEVRIPRRYMLVDSGAYEMTLDATLAFANAAMSAIFTGVARAAFEEALAYSKERVQGGKRICEHQLVQKHLFGMFRAVEACRAFSRAAMIYNTQVLPPQTHYSIAAKTFCTEAAFEVASTALQIFGGNGLSREYAIEKILRDARASLIEDGCNDILELTGAPLLLERYGA